MKSLLIREASFQFCSSSVQSWGSFLDQKWNSKDLQESTNTSNRPPVNSMWMHFWTEFYIHIFCPVTVEINGIFALSETLKVEKTKLFMHHKDVPENSLIAFGTDMKHWMLWSTSTSMFLEFESHFKLGNFVFADKRFIYWSIREFYKNVLEALAKYIHVFHSFLSIRLTRRVVVFLTFPHFICVPLFVACHELQLSVVQISSNYLVVISSKTLKVEV